MILFFRGNAKASSIKDAIKQNLPPHMHPYEIINVETISLDDLIDTIGKDIKLIKIEAEGAEPEVLEGLDKNISKVNYITIDAGFERNGKSTISECIHYLLSRNL